MIQKIQSGEYLQRLDNMSAGDRESYMKRVGEWLDGQAQLLIPKACEDAARFQNAIQCSTSWNDEECMAWSEGTILLSALAPTADTWLPDMLYVKAAKRAIMQMVTILEICRGAKENTETGDTGTEKAPAEETGEEVEQTPFQESAGHGDITGGDNTAEVQIDAVPQRPKHIDQYVHLLPKSTQEKAATVKGLLRDLDVAREKMNLLTDDPKASADSRAAWAKTATKLDNKVKGIYRELDAEWANLVKSGRVTVDDFGNARIIPIPQSSDETPDQEPAADGTEAAEELTSEQKARRRSLRKWLTDTRNGNGATREEHIGKWKNNFMEYLTLEGNSAYDDEKIKAAAAHYGISLVWKDEEHETETE